MHVYARRFSMVVLAVSLFACGGVRQGPVDASKTGDNSARPLPNAGQFYTPGIPIYGAKTGLGISPLERQVRAKLIRTLQPPPAVDCLAREYAARFAVDARDIDPGTVQSLAHHCGYWGVPQDTYSVTAPNRAALDTHLKQLPTGELTGAVGVGVVEHADDKITVSLIAAPAAVQIEPISRTLGKLPVQLQGRILRGDGQTEVWVSQGNGDPEELKIERRATGEFSATIPISPPGPYRIEIVRQTGHFRATVALLLLHTTPPRSYTPFGEAGPRDHNAMVAAVNGARKAQGLKPLKHRESLDARLDGWLARAAAAGGPTKAPAGMTESDGMAYGRLRYTYARGADAQQAMQLLRQSPTGQRAVFAPDDDEVAVGLKPFTRGTGFDAVVVAMRSFDRMPGPQARAIVRAKLLAQRKARSVEPLRENQRLQALAESSAAEVLSGTLPWKQVVPHLMQRVRDGRLASGSFAAGAFTVVGPNAADFTKEAQAFAAEMRYLGLGVIGGSLPGDGVPRYIVIYVVAQGLPGDG